MDQGEAPHGLTATELHRPQIHFSPERNWMNDPNGLVYADGYYHLFYQYNPAASSWGNLHWGHARGRDLLHWERRPIALEPDAELGMAFSGSAVVDADNTSGLFPEGGGLLAFYTAVVNDNGDFSRQSQCLAFSTDAGDTWTPYEHNPIIPNNGSPDFRDPKVLWHDESASWVMVLAHGHEVLIYRSRNLLDWTAASSFGGDYGSHAGQWECPDLFQLSVQNGTEAEERWVLTVSVGEAAPLESSGTQYFLGDFDGSCFIPEGSPNDVLWADRGRDFYAAQSWWGLPPARKRSVWIAWMNQWSYCHELPTSPWRGQMTLPRELALRRLPSGLTLMQVPVRETAGLRQRKLPPVHEPPRPGVPREYELVAGAAHEIRAALPVAHDGAIRLRVTYPQDAELDIRIDYAAGRLSIDRSHVAGGGFSPRFGGSIDIDIDEILALADHETALRIYLDRSSIELFLADGLIAATELIFPPGFAEKLLIEDEGRVRAPAAQAWKAWEVWELASIW